MHTSTICKNNMAKYKNPTKKDHGKKLGDRNVKKFL